jgi:hypothetical protein
MLRSRAYRNFSVLAIACIGGCTQPADEEMNSSGAAVGEKPEAKLADCGTSPFQNRLAQIMGAAVASAGWGSSSIEALRSDLMRLCRDQGVERTLRTCAFIDGMILPPAALQDEARAAGYAREIKGFADGYVRGTSLNPKAPATKVSCDRSLASDLATTMEEAVKRHRSNLESPYTTPTGLAAFRKEILPLCAEARSNRSEAATAKTCDLVNTLATIAPGEDEKLFSTRAGTLARFVNGYARAFADSTPVGTLESLDYGHAESDEDR